MHFVYILQSDTDSSYYVGSTQDVELRLTQHNEGWSRSTKGKRPWRVVYAVSFPDKSTALKREYEIKRMKSRKYIEQLIASH